MAKVLRARVEREVDAVRNQKTAMLPLNSAGMVQSTLRCTDAKTLWVVSGETML